MTPPPLPYVAVAESFKLPSGANFGGTAGVAFNSKGNIFVIHRGPMPLMEFDPDGHFIRGFGDGLFDRPHGLRIDAHDNIWATDVAANLVYKFNPSGRLEMVLGVKGHTGEWHPFGHLRLFHEPNEAVVGPIGDIFVLQGHGKGEPRVLKFASDGSFIKTLGRQGEGAGRIRSAALAGVRRTGAALHRRPQQRAHPGVRRRRQLHPRVAASRRAVRAVHGRRPAHLAGAWPHRPDHETRSQRQGGGDDRRRRPGQDDWANTARRTTSRSVRATRFSSPTR